MRDGRVARFGDDLSAYEALSQRTRSGNGDDKPKAKGRSAGGGRSRNHMKALERRERQLTGEIERATRHLAELERKLADPTTYRRDPSLIEELARERGRTQTTLERAEESWLEVQEEIEANGSN